METTKTTSYATQEDQSPETVWEGVKGRLTGFIRSRIPSAHDSEDILQEVFIRFFTRYEELKSIERLTSWFFTVARNLITDSFRKRRIRNTAHPASTDLENNRETPALLRLAADAEYQADRPLLESEINGLFLKALEELPPEQRNAFIWHELDDLSFADMAAMTGLPINTLISRKRYAVMALREKLSHIYKPL